MPKSAAVSAGDGATAEVVGGEAAVVEAAGDVGATLGVEARGVAAAVEGERYRATSRS
jgi:hypothetical protein